MATKLFGDAKLGATSVSLDMLLLKTADGTPDTGKVAAGLTAYYHPGGAATTAVTLADLALLTTAWTSGGVKEIADGLYRVDWPNAAFSSGDYVTLVLKDGTTAVAMERVNLEAHGADDVYGALAGGVTVGDKTGFALAAGSIATATFAAGATLPRVTLCDTVTTYTGNTPQTGDAYARVGAGGAGLTALGDARLAHLDADVSSRLATSGYTAPLTTLGATAPDGWLRTATFAAGATVPRVTLADTATNLTNAPTAGDFTGAMKASLNASTPTLSSPESLTGAAVSATTTGVVIGATGSTAFNATPNAYAGAPARYLTFTSGANKGLCVTVTGSSYASPNLTLTFAASAGVVAAAAGDTVQVD